MFAKLKTLTTYFSKFELALWSGSIVLIWLSFLLFDRERYLTLTASCIGVSSLILNAKGNPLGQLLTIIFSVLYGIISFSCAYYGEMITYLGMTAPMAGIALVSWLRNPYQGNQAEVAIRRITKPELIWMGILTILITTVFYFILKAFHTANLIPSTISVATSFLAVFLTFRRSAFYAIAYAANDMVLLILWGLAARTDSSYLSVLLCFLLFLINDIYGFINWKSMQKRQEQQTRQSSL